ncbi:S-adenosyl-L-methionine-dependent methyltransferase [Gautieria morchelliformis]|nr:S-adenosyl-L-methionine-dependent methyltransferase [Gautieria morchelliformis]
MAAFLNLKPGMHLLELGCGTGGIALELANFANVTILGVDADSNKIHTASSLARSVHMSAQVAFLNVDFLQQGDMLPAEGFDRVYSIEGLRIHPSFEECFRQVCRLLKPGGKFAVYEWCWTSTFSALDPEHCRMANLIETTTGIGGRPPSERSIDAAVSAIYNSGLTLIHREDLTARHDDKPWYFPLEVALSDGRIPWQPGNNICGLTQTAATTLVEAGKRQIFTPMALFVRQRPE